MKVYTVHTKHSVLEGPLELYRYGDGQIALVIDGERISVNLSEYGYVALPGQFYCKNYSENEGLPDALVEAGIARKVKEIFIGQFRSSAWLMELNTSEVAFPPTS